MKRKFRPSTTLYRSDIEYLGYEITVQHADRKITKGRRAANGTIALRLPLDGIKAKRAPTGVTANPGTGQPC